MSYTLLIKKQVKKALQNVPQPDRTRIAEKIVLLGKDPDDPILDIKKLKGEPYFRLRVGSWRIIFDRDDEVRIITIEKIKPRGGAYK
ncbi:TPA: type II toxin-antitoxin system RelE/ParE family toxin [Legionella pneumophila]|nr:type II toxin-antitoxin system RelE/ParE family toxin [Legionella pneumophila]HDV5807105.1 type II toxin-antitoxin system RelE/ParE family toxin [Legionella pneumophila]